MEGQILRAAISLHSGWNQNIALTNGYVKYRQLADEAAYDC